MNNGENMSNLLMNKDVERMASDYITLNLAYGQPATYYGFYTQVLGFFKEVQESEGMELDRDGWKRLIASIDVQTIMAWKTARQKFKALAARL
jgi:hypothetical protein